MKRCFSMVLSASVCAVLFVSCSGLKPLDGMSLNGFQPLFDGETLNGWHKLTGYSGDAGKWTVTDGVILGESLPYGKDCLFVTDKKFGDFEYYAELKADIPFDSGMFLRVQPNVLSYQITLDNHPTGEVGAIYSPHGGGFLLHNKEAKKLWKAGEFNALRARITGQPPHIEGWLNGTKIVDYQDTKHEGNNRVPDTGFIGIQVHPVSGDGIINNVHYRNLMVKELK